MYLELLELLSWGQKYFSTVC